MGRWRETAVDLAVAAASTVVFAGLLETAARLAEDRVPAPPTASYITEWMEGGDAFFTVKSTAVGWPPWEDYNHDGVRDREHALAKPPGRERVVCLGDSVTLGYGIEPAQAWPQVLQDDLAARGVPAEVFNVAFGGWSTRQELIAYRRIARKYRPDRVLLGICLNDIPEMGNNLARPPSWLMALHRRSALVRRVVGARDREIHGVEELFVQPPAPKVAAAFERVFADIRALRDETRADGATLAVLVFPFRFQVLPGAPAPVAQQTLATFCRREGLAMLDLLPAVQTLGADAYNDYDHFSPAGAAAVARAVAEAGLAGTAAPAAGTLVADVPELERRLGSPDAATRANAAWRLGQAGAAARPARGPLTSLLDDPDPEVRWRAEAALEALGVDAGCCLTTLTAAAADARHHGRAEALKLLGGLGAAAVPVLESALADARVEVRSQAVRALGRIGPAAHAALPALEAAFDDADLRWEVVDAIGQVGPDAAAEPVLLRGLRDASSSVRWRAASALGREPRLDARAVDALAALADDASENVRLAVVEDVAREDVPVEVAVRVCRARLDDDDSRVRLRSVKTLAHRDATVAREVLPRHAADPDPEVRAAIEKALRKRPGT